MTYGAAAEGRGGGGGGGGAAADERAVQTAAGITERQVAADRPGGGEGLHVRRRIL